MKKKILVISVLLLTFAFISIPVMAAPAIKKDATITVVSGPPVIDELRYVSDGTITHGRGVSDPEATVTLTIPGIGTYTGTWHTEWIANGNWKKVSLGMDGKAVIPSKNTMTFPEGTFEGVNQRRITGPNAMFPTTVEDYCVYKGISGDFKGWTLKVTGDVGYVIIPKPEP
jgi:hypothetical protein